MKGVKIMKTNDEMTTMPKNKGFANHYQKQDDKNNPNSNFNTSVKTSVITIPVLEQDQERNKNMMESVFSTN